MSTGDEEAEEEDSGEGGPEEEVRSVLGLGGGEGLEREKKVRVCLRVRRGKVHRWVRLGLGLGEEYGWKKREEEEAMNAEQQEK